MVCPKCKNKDFDPSPEVRTPLVNLGGKEKYESFDMRRYTCLQCGYSFTTKEEHYHEIKASTRVPANVERKLRKIRHIYPELHRRGQTAYQPEESEHA